MSSLQSIELNFCMTLVNNVTNRWMYTNNDLYPDDICLLESEVP